MVPTQRVADGVARRRQMESLVSKEADALT